MPLAGEGGNFHSTWLKKGTDLHACVEFKYPTQDPLGKELLVRSLCEELGSGVPEDGSLRVSRNAGDFARDEDWPFNWPLAMHVIRA